MATLNELVSIANARIAKKFYESFRLKHGKTRFVDNKRYKSEWSWSETGELLFEILLPAYTYFSDRGRGPGKRPPVAPLLEWVRFKGIEKDSKKALGIAFAIANKIAREGTSDRPRKTLLEPKRYAFEEVKKLAGAEVRRRMTQYLGGDEKTLVIKL